VGSYKVYIRGGQAPEPGKEIVLEVMDEDTFEKYWAKVLVSPLPDDLPDGETLWLQEEGKYAPRKEPWVIKIIERIESVIGVMDLGASGVSCPSGPMKMVEKEDKEVRVKEQQAGIGKMKGGMLKALLDKDKKGGN